MALGDGRSSNRIRCAPVLRSSSISRPPSRHSPTEQPVLVHGDAVPRKGGSSRSNPGYGALRRLVRSRGRPSPSVAYRLPLLSKATSSARNDVAALGAHRVHPAGAEIQRA